MELLITSYPDTELLSRLSSGGGPSTVPRSWNRQHFESLCIYIENNNGSRQEAEVVEVENAVGFL